MIDLENAKKEFLKYVSNYDDKISSINRKIYHSLRVMGLSKNISKSLNLNEEEINLACLIGLLHDIARFEQYKNYQTFSDYKSFDHGDMGVKILEKDNFIRKFIETDKYDEIIKIAIKNHNKFSIEEGLDENTLMFAKIIKDADKLDIFYEASELMLWHTDDEIKEIEEGTISEDYLNTIKKHECILKDENKHSKIDSVVLVASFIFDTNFKYTFRYLLENDLINKMFDKFNYKIEETVKQIKLIEKISYEYLKEKI